MENKTSKNILLGFMGLLILGELVCGIVTLGEEDLLPDIINLIPSIFIALYGFWLYKKPHGNMLKYAMLILAVSQMLLDISLIKNGFDPYYSITVLVFASGIIIYISGRLNRIEQNKFLLPIVFVMRLVCDLVIFITYSAPYSLLCKLTWFSDAITILTLMIAYFVRFKEHKEAGLMDAPKE